MTDQQLEDMVRADFEAWVMSEEGRRFLGVHPTWDSKEMVRRVGPTDPDYFYRDVCATWPGYLAAAKRYAKEQIKCTTSALTERLRTALGAEAGTSVDDMLAAVEGLREVRG